MRANTLLNYNYFCIYLTDHTYLALGIIDFIKFTDHRDSLAEANMTYIVTNDKLSSVTSVSIYQQTKELPSSLHPSVNSKGKRALDVFGAIAGLTITGILLLPIAIAIKLDSPGSIFFSQIRCGHQGKPFRIWKFRSMVTNASELQHLVKNKVKGPLFKNENDPRITRVGRFLRKTSLDEFPQFWNVLRGEMSLVGTRPPTHDEVATYKVEYLKRLDVKPGLTGEWQVNGRSTIEDFAEVLRLDLRYQQKWSLFYDLKLILKTIRLIFSSKSGAC